MPDEFNQLGLMGWPLLACSLLALTICLERSVFFARAWWKRAWTYQNLVKQITQYRSQPKAVRDEFATLLIDDLQARYHQGLKLLRMVGTISPMLGLLGTILGIIKTFQAIAAHQGPVSPSLIADGLWEAMLTTAFGLMIALPALLLAYLFSAISDKQLDQFCMDLNRHSLSFDLDRAK